MERDLRMKSFVKGIIILSMFSMLLGIGACKKKSADQVSDTIERDVVRDDYSKADIDDNEKPQQKGKVVSDKIKTYEYTWTNSDQIPPVVIIIDDFGYIKGDLLDDFNSLPKEIVFAILPDLPNTELAVQKATQVGREAIIHIPMEAISNSTSPGARYIKDGMAKDDIKSMIEDFYKQVPSAIAVNNHMGSKSTSDSKLMQYLMEVLTKQNLGFVDSVTSSSSVAFQIARREGLQCARRDIFLDVPDNSESTIIQKIESLGKYKGRSEPIIIISHCHNRDKLSALQSFIAQIKAMGIRIITLKEAMSTYPT